jgi:hypothetical protein
MYTRNNNKALTAPGKELIQLDYMFSNEAFEIDRGIRDTIKGMRMSILATGIALARIKENRFFKELGFRSITGYANQLCVEYKMDRSNMFRWLSIGEAYFKYQSELEQISFNESDGPSKLQYIDRALFNNKKNDVFENIKNMTVRDFKAFSRNVRADKIIPNKPGKSKTKIRAIGKKMTIKDNDVYIGNNCVITINSDLGIRTSKFFKDVILLAGKALEEGWVILPIKLNDKKEARRFKPALYRLLEEMRLKH